MTENILVSKLLLEQVINSVRQIGHEEGKKEMLNKFASLNLSAAVLSDLGLTPDPRVYTEQVHAHEYRFEAEKKNREEAEKFCETKTMTQLQEYLSDRLVAYNSWKDADYDELVQIVVNVYEAGEV